MLFPSNQLIEIRSLDIIHNEHNFIYLLEDLINFDNVDMFNTPQYLALISNHINEFLLVLIGLESFFVINLGSIDLIIDTFFDFIDLYNDEGEISYSCKAAFPEQIKGLIHVIEIVHDANWSKQLP